MGTAAATAGRDSVAAQHHPWSQVPVQVRLKGHRPNLAITHRGTIEDHRLVFVKPDAFSSVSVGARVIAPETAARSAPCPSSTA